MQRNNNYPDIQNKVDMLKSTEAELFSLMERFTVEEWDGIQLKISQAYSEVFSKRKQLERQINLQVYDTPFIQTTNSNLL